MTSNINWTKDPIVVIEKAMLPVVWQIGALITKHALGEVRRENDLAPFTDAIHMMRKRGPELLHAVGAPLLTGDRHICNGSADVIENAQDQLEVFLASPFDQDSANTLHLRSVELLSAAVDRALDVFRARFITFVLEKQSLHQKQAQEAITGLDRISKQIFFISINASIEAARVGDAGKGFLQISTDIRALSQSAQTATLGLSQLMLDRSKAA